MQLGLLSNWKERKGKWKKGKFPFSMPGLLNTGYGIHGHIASIKFKKTLQNSLEIVARWMIRGNKFPGLMKKSSLPTLRILAGLRETNQTTCPTSWASSRTETTHWVTYYDAGSRIGGPTQITAVSLFQPSGGHFENVRRGHIVKSVNRNST